MAKAPNKNERKKKPASVKAGMALNKTREKGRSGKAADAWLRSVHSQHFKRGPIKDLEISVLTGPRLRKKRKKKK